MDEHPALNLLSDDPRDGSSARPDELDRQGYAQHLVKLLDNVRAQSDSTVLGLIGDWGTGKSSVLEMLRNQLKAPWLVATFNPWTYPDTASLQRGFFTELSAALPEDDRPSSARTTIAEFARTISPLGKFGGLFGVDLENTITSLSDLIAGDTSASAAKVAAEEALGKSGNPVLMLVDDLDRLTPDELLEVLKLVRLVGRLPHVYYLLSYDERTLLDVLQRTDITGDDESRARAYMEKIVQVRLDLPALRATQRSALLNKGLEEILANNHLRLTDEDERRLSEIYSSALDRRLSTPRAITRFLGQVQAFYPLLHAEVDFVDFFLLSWIRTQEPGLYAMLQTERDALLGQGLSIGTVRREPKDQVARREWWEAKLKAAQVQSEHIDGVKRVLSTLFPELQAAFSDTQHYVGAQGRETPRAMSDPDYFDRYVSFGVPQDDVPDSLVNQALDDLQRQEQTTATSRLTDEIRLNTARTIRKLDTVRESRPLPESLLFTFIAEAAPSIDRRRIDIFDDPWRSAVRGAAICLANLDGAAAAKLVEQVGADARLEEFVIDAVWYLQSRQSSSSRPLVTADYPLGLVERAASVVLTRSRANWTKESPLHDGALTSFWAWRDLDADAANAWLRGQVDSGKWTLVDTLGALTSVAVSIGTVNPTTSIGSFSTQVVDEIFTFERVFRDLSEEIGSAEPPSGESMRVSATPENRISYSLSELRKARDLRIRNSIDSSG